MKADVYLAFYSRVPAHRGVEPALRLESSDLFCDSVPLGSLLGTRWKREQMIPWLLSPYGESFSSMNLPLSAPTSEQRQLGNFSGKWGIFSLIPIN